MSQFESARNTLTGDGATERNASTVELPMEPNRLLVLVLTAIGVAVIGIVVMIRRGDVDTAVLIGAVTVGVTAGPLLYLARRKKHTA